MGNLFQMISEINKINDHTKKEECLQKIYEWYKKKIQSTFINKLTKSKASLLKATVEGSNRDETEIATENGSQRNLPHVEDDLGHTRDSFKTLENQETIAEFKNLTLKD